MQRMKTVNTVIAASIINAFESFIFFFPSNGAGLDPHWGVSQPRSASKGLVGSSSNITPVSFPVFDEIK